MATNATIASQISRITAASNNLRSKGIELGLSVPIGTYWDYSAGKDITTTVASALKETDQIDKVAAAFDQINFYPQNEIKVPILLKTNGTTVVGETTPLAPGFYSGALIKPFITVENNEDFVIDVQSKTVLLKAKSNVDKTPITPDDGYNYMNALFYTIQDGTISSESVSYDNTGVTVNVEDSGWLDVGTKKVTVDTSEMTSKVGDEEASVITSGTDIIPSPTADTTLTITKGIYGSDRTLVVKSVSSQTPGNAGVNDILEGRVAWVNGKEVIGEMPNHGGEEGSEERTAAASLQELESKLAIQPVPGYYNNYSVITTTIAYNPPRKFSTVVMPTNMVDTMSAQTYYETIPAGYYPNSIIRKVAARNASARIQLDTTTHTLTLMVGQSGWIDSGDVEAFSLNVGEALFELTEDDLNDNLIVLTPNDDIDGTRNSYMTQVTVDNTVISNLLAAI